MLYCGSLEFTLFSHRLEVSLISIKSIINNVFECASRIGKRLVINMCETHTQRVVARSDDGSPLVHRADLEEKRSKNLLETRSR